MLTYWAAIMTDLGRDLDTKTMQGLVASTEVWKTADQGAATLVVAGFDPKLESMLNFPCPPF
jgi:hypothetical protein